MSTNSSNPSVKVAIYGLGAIGRMVFDSLLNETFFYNRRIELVGVIDISNESRDWAEKRGIKSFQNLETLLNSQRPDVIIHTTASDLNTVIDQINSIVKENIPVVSSAEELFFPWVRHPEQAQALNQLCLDNKVAILGTGVNPGFIMDVLPAHLTQACQSVEQIRITRIVNASTRRPPLQRKIGIGLDESTFRNYVDNGRLSSVGLMESIDFLSAHMGWTLTASGQRIEPIIAKKDLKTGTVSVRKGDVCGMRHQAWGEIKSKKVIDLDLRIFLDPERTGDQIVIGGNPPLQLWIDGGTPGEPATVSSLIRGIPIVLRAKPGIVRRLERDHF